MALHDTAAQVPKHDMLVVLGDMNAKIGKDDKDFEEVLRRMKAYFLTFAMQTTWSLEAVFFRTRKYTRSHGCHLMGLQRIRSTTSPLPGTSEDH